MGSTNPATEEMTGIQGLININTANWKVLSAIPFTTDSAANANIALGIVRYRDGDPTKPVPTHQPFRSLFDLYKVPEFIELVAEPLPRNANGKLQKALLRR